MTARAARESFTNAQAAYRKAQAQESAYRTVLLSKYGRLRPPAAWLTRSEQRKLDVWHNQRSRASDRLFKVLDEHGGRSWRDGVPAHWVMTELTWEDATTKGELSSVPPPGYGYSEHYVRQFAAAVAS